MLYFRTSGTQHDPKNVAGASAAIPPSQHLHRLRRTGELYWEALSSGHKGSQNIGILQTMISGIPQVDPYGYVILGALIGWPFLAPGR